MTNHSMPIFSTGNRPSRVGQLMVWLLSSALISGPLLLAPSAAWAALPTNVEMNLGPIASLDEPSNIVLALSVEFPTVGAAYRETTFNATKTYQGYWDPKACYKYKDSTNGAPLGGQYFYRSNPVEASTGYCNRGGATGEYSGNLLNYSAHSAIDILRMGLTGGNRVEDSATATVLERAYLRKSWYPNNSGGYFPTRGIPATALGTYMPAKPANVTVGTNVYSSSCNNLIWFGSSNASQTDCLNPAANIRDLSPLPNILAVAYEAENATVTAGTNSRDARLQSAADASGGQFRSWVGYGSKIAFSSVNVSAAGSYDIYVIYYGTSDANNSRPLNVSVNGGTAVAVTRTSPDQFGKVTATLKAGNNTITLIGPANGDSPNIDGIAQPVPAGTALSTPVYARVRVCDANDATARTTVGNKLCTQYPNGNYKPIGEIQRQSANAKVGVFAYLANGGGNSANPTYYGGVMRAPLSFVGPTVRNSTTGATSANANAEWDAQTGVFSAQPRGTNLTGANKSTYPKNGAINYLNGFGTLNPSNLGYYKEFDTFNGLYFETLRYYMGATSAEAAAYSVSGTDADDTDADNFPYYKTWTDPITSTCQRKNYVLAIGDVNTHGAGQIQSKSIAGSNVSTWTGVVRNFESAAGTDFTSNSLAGTNNTNTAGNPNARTIADDRRLDMAGASYAANTQRMRSANIGANGSPDAFRVKTFGIDVDEGGDGTIDGTTSSRATAGVKPRNSSLYLMGKYGWFNNNTRYQTGANLGLADNHPFTSTTANAGPYDNVKWQDPGVPNTPDGYVIASQADRMLDGITKFFNAANTGRTSIFAASMGNTSFSNVRSDGSMYVSSYDAKDWTGTIQKRRLTFNVSTDANNNVTGSQLNSVATLWDAGKLLNDASLLAANAAVPDNAMVKPADRKIYTYSKTGFVGKEFKTNGGIDQAVLDALKMDYTLTTPAASTDPAFPGRVIDWVRGDRSSEVAAGSNDANRKFRARVSVMGDVINSGPVYKQGANPDLSGAGYADFAASLQAKPAVGQTPATAGRTPMVYSGANDGMLHAFNANTGKEVFAYIPYAVSKSLGRLTSPAYEHRPYVDGVPAVDEVQFTTGTGANKTQTWGTMLVSGMGGGARGVFALNVTDPDNFGVNKVMFEFTDANDADMGNVVGQPKLVRVNKGTIAAPDYRWYVAVSSGFNNFASKAFAAGDANNANLSATGDQYLFLLSVDNTSGTWTQGTNYYKFKVGPSSGLSNPGVAYGLFGDAQLMYAGDTSGNLWRFDLRKGLGDTNAVVVKLNGASPEPMAIARANAAGPTQPITTPPLVTPGLGKGYMVSFATGKFMESSDASDTAVQGIYGIWDDLSDNYSIDRSKLFRRTIDRSTGLTKDESGNTNTQTFAFGDGTTTGGVTTYRGWYVALPSTGERVIVDGAVGPSYVAFNSLITGSEQCAAASTGASINLGTLYGGIAGKYTPSDVVLGRPSVIDVDETTTTYAYGTREATGGRKVKIITRTASPTTTAGVKESANVETTITAGRVGWRQIKNFN